jgi:hypothetical protein
MCYFPIREWFFIGTAPDKFFLARKRRITVKLDFRMELHRGVPLQ